MADLRHSQERKESREPAERRADTERDPRAREFLEAVSRLPRREKQIINLCYGSALADQEIAVLLNLQESQVSQLRRKAISMLLAETARVAPEDLDELCLDEREELLAKKYAAGLQPHEAARLAEIYRLLAWAEIRKADLIDAQGDERLARIDAGLDRVEKAIHDLQALNLH